VDDEEWAEGEDVFISCRTGASAIGREAEGKDKCKCANLLPKIDRNDWQEDWLVEHRLNIGAACVRSQQLARSQQEGYNLNHSDQKIQPIKDVDC